MLYANLNTIIIPLSIGVLVYLVYRLGKVVSEQVEEVRSTAEESSETLVQTSLDTKKEIDAKLEVIRGDVNSNLTEAIATAERAVKDLQDIKLELVAVKTELALLKTHFGVVEGQPLPISPGKTA
jgi:hypothetical protein